MVEEEEEDEDEEAGGEVMVESGWGEPGRTIKMSLAAGRRRRRVVPSVRIGRRRKKRRRRRTAAYTDEDPVGEFMRRPNKTLDGHTSREAFKIQRKATGWPSCRNNWPVKKKNQISVACQSGLHQKLVSILI